ncbi:MAG: response regulator transcription factor [Chloroflexi bacterium]|uniref:Response regulator transcription factor n=1 Tax=Candidatus Chlorohelix allophototropha TaxID=3003348 RepID=A0A8T7LYB4_9CHLR|nr:response regulator transcription factor [Chloroflexota bacterium]WJW67863.1 response regulator transcription factor [Chloroflexota bacterium L227-S17]
MKETGKDPGKSGKPRVLVIDDEPRMVDFIKLGLEYEGFEVECAFDGKTGLKMALAEPPDLIILDLMLPGMDGFEVCQRLRTTHDVPVIMLTARDELNDRVHGLDLGADDYLTKPFQFKELAARIRAVMRRKSSLPVEQTGNVKLLQLNDVTLDPNLRELRRGAQTIELSAREFDLLSLLMSHPNQVLTREIILERVWGYDFMGEGNVIEVYVRYLRQKLGEPNLIYTVRGVGYVMRSKPKESLKNEMD